MATDLPDYSEKVAAAVASYWQVREARAKPRSTDQGRVGRSRIRVKGLLSWDDVGSYATSANSSRRHFQ